MSQKTIDQIRTDAPAAALSDADIILVQQSEETKGGILSQLKEYLFGGVMQEANLVLAGPASGGDDVPTFRELVLADIPDLSSLYQGASISLGAISALSPAANKIVYFTGSADAGLLDISTDPALGESDTTVSSQKAVKDYVDGVVEDLEFALLGDVSTSGITTSSETILGRISEDTGAVEKIPLGPGLAFDAGALRSTVTDIEVQDSPESVASLDPGEDDIAVIVAAYNTLVTAHNALIGILESAGVLREPVP